MCLCGSPVAFFLLCFVPYVRRGRAPGTACLFVLHFVFWLQCRGPYNSNPRRLVLFSCWPLVFGVRHRRAVAKKLQLLPALYSFFPFARGGVAQLVCVRGRVAGRRTRIRGTRTCARAGCSLFQHLFCTMISANMAQRMKLKIVFFLCLICVYYELYGLGWLGLHCILSTWRRALACSRLLMMHENFKYREYIFFVVRGLPPFLAKRMWSHPPSQK